MISPERTDLSYKFLDGKRGIRVTELQEHGGEPVQFDIFFDAEDINALRQSYVYIVMSGERGEGGSVECVKWRLASAKRSAHALMSRREGHFDWTTPNKKAGEFCRWEAGGVDYVSIRKANVS